MGGGVRLEVDFRPKSVTGRTATRLSSLESPELGGLWALGFSNAQNGSENSKKFGVNTV
jgi:hypothetical protein